MLFTLPWCSASVTQAVKSHSTVMWSICQKVFTDRFISPAPSTLFSILGNLIFCPGMKDYSLRTWRRRRFVKHIILWWVISGLISKWWQLILSYRLLNLGQKLRCHISFLHFLQHQCFCLLSFNLNSSVTLQSPLDMQFLWHMPCLPHWFQTTYIDKWELVLRIFGSTYKTSICSR